MFIYTAGTRNEKLNQYIKELPPGDYLVTIKKNRPIRSLSANKYYHCILNILGAHTGHTHEQLHDICKKKFNAEVINLPKSGSEIRGKSTTNLDTKEFAAYVNRVKMWAMDEFGVIIPESKDIDYARWMAIENEYEQVHSGF